jgi:hypothetical protein
MLSTYIYLIRSGSAQIAIGKVTKNTGLIEKGTERKVRNCPVFGFTSF